MHCPNRGSLLCDRCSRHPCRSGGQLRESSLKVIIVSLGVLLVPVPALAQQTRLPPIPPERYDEVQKKAVVDLAGSLRGPWQPLLYSPELMMAALQMGRDLRYKAAVGTTLSELAILVTAREWSQDYEWSVHAPIAVKAGINPDVVDAIAEGRRPTGMSPDEEICYDFSIELHRNKRVSDSTYARAKDRFGEKGVVDLAAINGYYAMIAMVTNVARIPVTEGPKLTRFPD
jgi:4-carboxymuconolactone decarboxylase